MVGIYANIAAAPSANITLPKGGYRPDEAADYLGISRWMLYELAKHDPKFPRPIRLTKRCVIYRQSSLDAYLQEKAEEEAAL